MSDRFYLIGEKLGHSFSKKIHDKLKLYKYDYKEIKKDKLANFLCGFGYKGLNVTIPYKESVLKYLDFVSLKVKKIVSVNTIIDVCGDLFGFNTDYYGLIDLLKHEKIKLENERVLILGDGGTAKTAAVVVLDMKGKVIAEVSHKEITNGDVYKYINKATCIINTTPVGMYPKINKSPIDISKFKKVKYLIDVIYNPLETKLAREAREQGIKAVNGLYMLYRQALYSAYIFTIADKAYSNGKILGDALEAGTKFDRAAKRFINIYEKKYPNLFNNLHKKI